MLARRPVPPPRYLQALPPPLGRAAAFPRDATPADLRRALESNQRQWLLRLARYGGDLIERDGGIVWHDRPEAAGEIQVPFPRFSPARIGEQLDALVARMHARPAPRPLRIWSSDPPRPADLAIRLLARGFRTGFRPRWMRLDLWRLRDVDWGPDGLWIEPVDDDALWERYPHPYHGPREDAAARAAVDAVGAAARALPDQIVRLAAWWEGRPVGAATLHLTGGPRGIAGIYDVGVLPACRNRGIGKALTVEACKTAWQLGCPIAGLNATPLGEPVYRRLGFEFVDEGQTWELTLAVVTAEAPSADLVAFAEAVGRGDVAALDGLAGRLPAGALDGRLGCGLRPIDLAARFGQADAAEWLLARGAALDLLAAWELGWTERAVRLLAERPELADARDDAGATPLHEAARRGDLDLASLVLAAGGDPAARDGVYEATPSEWARQLGHPEVSNLLDGGGGW